MTPVSEADVLLNCSSVCIGIQCTNTCDSRHEGIKGSGTITERFVSFDSFNEIEIGNGLQVTIQSSDAPQVMVRSDDNIQPLVDVVVRDNVLKLGLKPGHYDGITIEVEVNANLLKKVSATGASTVRLTDMDISELVLDLSGTASIDAEDTRVTQLLLTTNGNNTARLRGIRATVASVELDGVAEVEIGFAGSDAMIKGTVSGVSNLSVCGRPNTTSVNLKGVSSLNSDPGATCE